MNGLGIGRFFGKKSSKTRETRSLGSNPPLRPSYNEAQNPLNYSLDSRDVEVRPSFYPCYDFLHSTGIRNDFDELVARAGLIDFVTDERAQHAKLTHIFVQTFKYNDSRFTPTVEFMLYDRPYKMDLSDFCR